MRSTTFRNVAIGILALAIAYHLGASRAGAQAPSNPVVASIPDNGAYAAAVITANGDIYTTHISALDGPWSHVNNIFSGTPVDAQRATFGQIQRKYEH